MATQIGGKHGVRTQGVISKALAKRLKKQFREASEEKQVEPIYHEFLRAALPSNYEIETKVGSIKTDGYIHPPQIGLFDGGLILLLEAKYNMHLEKISERAKIVAQAIYYSHLLAEQGREKPMTFLCGDEDQMFMVYAAHFDPLLSENVGDPEWRMKPSEAVSNGPLLRALIDGGALNTLVYNMNDRDFDFNVVAERLRTLHLNGGALQKIEITERNLRALLERFEKSVELRRPRSKTEEEWSRAVVSIFTNAITGHTDQFLIPGTSHLQLVDGTTVGLNTAGWATFFDTYEKVRSQDAKNRFREISEGLVPEVQRRASGDFWTPTEWVNRAHEALGDALGKDWRGSYSVWDPAWGTGNLTRDFSFSSLYASTLFESELQIATHVNDNENTTKFQFDFLNDDLDLAPGGKITPEGLVLKPQFVPVETDSEEVKGQKQAAMSELIANSRQAELYYKIPASLYADLSDPKKPFCWILNPPYARAGNAGKKAAGAGATKTGVQQLISADSEYRGRYSSNLYSQFYYRILKIATDFRKEKYALGSFSKSQYLCGGTFWEPLLKMFSERLEYCPGFLMNAGEFQDVSQAWGVLFAVWKSGSTSSREFPISIEELTADGVKAIGTHTLRATSDQTIRTMIPIPDRKNITKGYEKKRWSLAKEVDWHGGFSAIGAITFHSQNVEQMNQYTWIDNGWISQSVALNPENFLFGTAALAMGRSISHTWFQDKDNFLRPSDTVLASDEFAQFMRDSVVIALLDPMTSLRSVPLAGDTKNIYNEWFWRPTKDVRRLAAQVDDPDVLQDLQNHLPLRGERFLCEWLEGQGNRNLLSPDAARLLSTMDEIYDYTFQFRQIDALDNPELSLQAWDAGWAQTHAVLQRRVKRSGENAPYFDERCLELNKQFAIERGHLLDRFASQVYGWGILLKPKIFGADVAVTKYIEAEEEEVAD